ncbi:MAG TPA: TRAP transporter small permease subunit [Casimicrobiaceae bacterium]|nr:TRAP transporter small permease subunit [Casimicrobiaceae bacterium]
MIRALDAFVDLILSGAKWLALPIVGALFLQWPLRDLVGAYSREANDLGQWIFALYVAVAITAATRSGTHLSADALARRYPAQWRDRLARLGILFGLLPWAIFVLVTSRNIVLSSVLQLERFPDTYHPGYYLIKIALWLLALLVLIQGLIDLVRPAR